MDLPITQDFTSSDVVVRSALPRDVPAISAVVAPYAQRGILLAKELVGFYESVQEFLVAEVHGSVVGCGALHVMWEDLAEVRTLAVDSPFLGHGVGHELLERLLDRARELEIHRVFCLTFEVDFFEAHGFTPLVGPGVPDPVYGQLLRSADDGVAEFLELSRVKANTLGNTRMLRYL
ncbi:MAG: amino-acid N-acetyltransferase [Promicromonosporaceae bacterium]|nr:amino-acid N-acetyltransferase [Promicromonosporaceae bacterium]